MSKTALRKCCFFLFLNLQYGFWVFRTEDVRVDCFARAISGNWEAAGWWVRIFSLFAAVLQDKLKGGWLGELAASFRGRYKITPLFTTACFFVALVYWLLSHLCFHFRSGMRCMCLSFCLLENGSVC